MKRDLLTILDLSREEIETLLVRARELKALQARRVEHASLKGKFLALIFDKPSTRTRVSFEVGMTQLGVRPYHAWDTGWKAYRVSSEQ